MVDGAMTLGLAWGGYVGFEYLSKWLDTEIASRKDARDLAWFDGRSLNAKQRVPAGPSPEPLLVGPGRNCRPHALCSLNNWDVFPETQDGPSVCLQSGRHAFVAGAIASKLVRPVLRVRGGHAAMLRTAMPKTPIDEHGYTSARKDHIYLRFGPIGRAQHEVFSEAQAVRVKLSS
jgi:hypothetical protein